MELIKYSNKLLKINGHLLKIVGVEPPLPPFTLRFKANRAVSLSDFRDTLPITLTLVDDAQHIYDVKLEQADWSNLFYPERGKNEWLIAIIAANTSGVTNMRFMFAYCTSLTSVSLFDTNSVTDMGVMFQACTSLTSVPLFDTSRVTNMVFMFDSCYSLTSVPLFDTNRVTDMRIMFRDCRKVKGGALALYTQASTQANPPSLHDSTFSNCGADTPTGLAELQQIPASWGGLAGALTTMTAPRGDNETDLETGLAELQQIPTSWDGRTST